MNDIDPQEFGEMRADIRNLTVAVNKLSETVEGLQKTKWTTKGIIAGLAFGGGAVGGKIAALFGGSPPTPPFHP